MQKVITILLIALYGSLGSLRGDDRWRRDVDGRWNGIRTRLLFPRNFISVRFNVHGEKELRIAYNKVLSMETTMKSEIAPDFDVVLRQVTNGRRIVNGVYQGGSLRECDIADDTAEILDFVSMFASPTSYSWEKQHGDVFESYASSNVTGRNRTLAYRFFDRHEYLEEFRDHVNMSMFRKECNAFLDIARNIVAQEVKSGHMEEFYSKFAEQPDTVSEKDMDKYAQDHAIKKRSTEPVKRSRTKRSSFDFKGALIFPGTKWCGKGDLAQCYEDLGDDKDLDSCCRDHDCCPYVIPPFSTKFNMFNYRLYSLLHCDCDQRFRGCLKSSLSTMANMIGKIYFNVLGSKCFEFEKVDICMERAWYGRCLRYEKKETAVIKGQVSFSDENSNNQTNRTELETETDSDEK